MCVYCERRKDVKIGWEQPCFYDENWQHSNNVIKDSISSNLNVDGQPDWEARIYDYQTTSPELVLTSKDVAQALWGDGIATIHIRIKRCPVCGRLLGKQTENNTDINIDMDLIIQFSMLWGMTIGSALNGDEQKQASEMKQYDSLELNRMFTEWSVEFKSQTVFEDSCDFFENKLKNLFEKR